MIRTNQLKHFDKQPFKKLVKDINDIAPKIELGEINSDEDDVTHIRDSNISWILPPGFVSKDSEDYNAEAEEKKEPIFQLISELASVCNFTNPDTPDQPGWEFKLETVEPLQYTVYDGEKKQHYDWHFDHYSNIEGALEKDVRKISFSIMLNRPGVDFEGGDLEFEISGPHAEERNVTHHLKYADAIFFPSYVWHRVKPVTSGIRKSLVGWVRGPQWK